MNVTTEQTPRHRSRRNVPKVHKMEVFGGKLTPACRPGWDARIASVTWIETDAEITCETCLGGMHVWRGVR